MATSIDTTKDELINKVRFYRQRSLTHYAYTDDDYLDLATQGYQKLYIDCGWSTWDADYTSSTSISKDLTLTQKQYAGISSELKFWEQAIADWGTLVGYTTDSLTITNAQKPAEFIEKRINYLNNILIDLFQKMTDDSNMSDISDVTVELVDYDFTD